jgi:hypothetical protein
MSVYLQASGSSSSSWMQQCTLVANTIGQWDDITDMRFIDCMPEVPWVHARQCLLHHEYLQASIF